MPPAGQELLQGPPQDQEEGLALGGRRGGFLQAAPEKRRDGLSACPVMSPSTAINKRARSQRVLPHGPPGHLACCLGRAQSKQAAGLGDKPSGLQKFPVDSTRLAAGPSGAGSLSSKETPKDTVRPGWGAKGWAGFLGAVSKFRAELGLLCTPEPPTPRRAGGAQQQGNPRAAARSPTPLTPTPGTAPWPALCPPAPGYLRAN